MSVHCTDILTSKPSDSMQGMASTQSALSVVHGPSAPELWHIKLGDLIERQADRYGDHTAAVFLWQSRRFSYHQLADNSRNLAKSMLALGLQHGECIAIMAGNCYQYIEAFLAAARIGLKDVSMHLDAATKESNALAHLKHVVQLGEQSAVTSTHPKIWTYSAFTSEGQSVPDTVLKTAQDIVKHTDILNLQFTSGMLLFTELKDSE